MNKEKFTFAVLTYNHESYIIEHLESIKFLIENFGAAYHFILIIADDGSKDRTVELANQWILANTNLFSDIKVLADGSNKGTCFNYTRLWPLIEGDLFKITAGDDVYSCIDMFKEVETLKENDFFSGLPLLLIDGKIGESRSTIFHILATDVIYKGKKLIERLRGISSINTPSLFCNKKFLKDYELSNFINSFSVTEDFPMIVKIANSYENITFAQANKIYIYYRRTSGSTYLIRGSDFDLDKLKAFDYMLSNEKNWLDRLILKNRIYCYKLNNTPMKKILNIGYYLYLFKAIVNLRAITQACSKSPSDTHLHQAHYDLIAKRANAFLKDQQNKRTPHENATP
ncbi:glycosyltransferase family 2 protein [Pseudomonas sp. B6002]|uniref:glycosyltransferase family 2 protein n=1 Tax=Pseudomonas sp. B6002 TaxID=2726978 RepID=UPI0015A3817A|nr:glycosyltransferase family 2 protein [Pseudomonas sp. B6002]NVZ53608.1 glycosyltransferase family 2 protein [Pseudomonas sp. B6002]